MLSGIGPIAVFIMRMLESTMETGDRMNWGLKVLPTFCLTNAIMYSSSKDRLFLYRPELKRDTDLDISLMGGEILVLGLHFGTWLLVLALIETGCFNFLQRLLFLLPKNRIPPRPKLTIEPDVLAEEQHVAANLDTFIRIHKFRKIYPSLFRKPCVAVEGTSFGLDRGDCFCLLGVNGAGKTTTFESVASKSRETSGEIRVEGREVGRVWGRIGYCPQDNCLFEFLSV